MTYLKFARNRRRRQDRYTFMAMSHYDVDDVQRFFNAEHTVSCVVFTLTPRR